MHVPCTVYHAPFTFAVRRSIPFMKEEINKLQTFQEYDNHEVDEGISPEIFNLEEYLSIVKAHRNKCESPGQDRFVFFILDTSGSIGKSSFNKLKSAIADLVVLLCDVKVAVMTYSSNMYREICYNCDQSSKSALHNAILSIKYRGGGSTASGDVIRCACDYMLNSPCRFTRNIHNPPPIDVIFLTDGHSNIGEDVCTATKCLNAISNINVFPIAVGSNINWQELNCIKGNNGNPNDILSVTDIDALLNLIRSSITKLYENPAYCIN